MLLFSQINAVYKKKSSSKARNVKVESWASLFGTIPYWPEKSREKIWNNGRLFGFVPVAVSKPSFCSE